MLEPRLVISNFEIVRPRFETTQDNALDWLAAAHTRSEMSVAENAGNRSFDPISFERTLRKALTRFGCDSRRVATRGHELEDFLHQDWQRMLLYPVHVLPRGGSADVRIDFFEHAADRVFSRLYDDPEISPPDELIHVTCTGYVAPSSAQKVVAKKGWQQNCVVTHAYHMGCYAAFPALRMGLASLRSSNHARVDLVHNEFCTLHLNPSDHSPEQLVIQSLFADGSIRYSLHRQKSSLPALEPLAISEEIAPDFLEAMSWRVSAWGMKMALSKEVPKRVGLLIHDFLVRLLAKAGLNFHEERKTALFAIHPGGPKIIDQLQQVLELTEEQVSTSRSALFRYGNMSSATVPHIWAEILKDSSIPDGKLVISLAFGPGLTVCGAVLRKYA